MAGGLSGHKHYQSVHAYAHARCGGHAVLECAHKVVVDNHGLVVAFCAQTHLLYESFVLVDGVVEL